LYGLIAIYSWFFQNIALPGADDRHFIGFSLFKLQFAAVI
jgi:hypothetical protein